MSSSCHDPRPPRASERGVALLFALFFAIIALGLTVAGTIFVRAHKEHTLAAFASHGQAVEFARSGLVEALGWFRKQTAQPVTGFQPQLDDAAHPPVLDTAEPDVGIVREFQISGSLWGRYEVWKDWPADPDATRLAFRNIVRCQDISDERGHLSPGSVWRLRSVGYVYRRNDDAVPYNQQPNRVIAKEVVETEIRRLALQPPGPAALCTRRGATCRVLTRGRVLGGSRGTGISYQLSGGTAPSVSGTGSQVTGVQRMAAFVTYNDDYASVFGVTVDELRGMADSSLADPNLFPSPIPKDSLVVLDG